jgi:KDO2-lipid IV(A) lauroyltransferase
MISDGLYVLLYYGMKYRKAVVMKNLSIAFPEKSEQERLRIAKDFYHSFIDNFIETIKIVSINKKTLLKRVSMNIEVANDLFASGQNLSMVSGHFFNWEFANLAIAANIKYPLITVYMPVKNIAFDKLMFNLRGKFGAIMVSATNFRHEFVKYARSQFALGLVADQSPGDPNFSYWIPFFTKPVPFVKGPEKLSKSNKSAVVFVHFIKIKRGYYHLDFKLVTTDPKSYADGTLSKELIHLLEGAIHKTPSNYLWSHRRWKWEFSEQYEKLLVK